MKKVQVNQITFARVEGQHSDLFNKVFATWQEVETAIKNAAITAPDDGGYDKCDFLIEWEDGFTYKGRFDMVRDHRNDLQPLAEHVTGYMKFLSGEQKPAHMNEKQYEEYVRDHKESAKEFLEKYHIGLPQQEADNQTNTEYGNGIFTVNYIQDGKLHESYAFTKEEKAMSFAKMLFARIFDSLDSDDYIAIEKHDLDSEKDSVRICQYDMDDAIEDLK